MSEQQVVERGKVAVVELLRLAIVGATTAVGYALGPWIADVLNSSDVEQIRFIASLLGALTGYVGGGGLGRYMVRQVDRAEERLADVEASVLIAGVLGAVLTATLSFALFWPTLLLPARRVTVPIAMVLVVALTYLGGRFGAARGGEMARFVGVRGRLQVRSPSKGEAVKVVDTSALIDGRMADVARAGFLDGTMVVPRFVLLELQGLADAEEPLRRDRGRRGLDILKVLQDDRRVVIEITDDEAPLDREVDTKLVTMARDRTASLITVDANLARVAEVSGVRVLNLHRLAESLRPPVIPGQSLEVEVVKEGREPGQGVGYLEDGTMVVVEGGADHLGATIATTVTSMTQNRNGRMLFATREGAGREAG